MNLLKLLSRQINFFNAEKRRKKTVLNAVVLLFLAELSTRSYICLSSSMQF